MASFNTSNSVGFSIKFSPFDSNYLALASGEHFGLKGRGGLHILGINPCGNIQEIETRHWSDALFDVAWSEINSNHILTGSGDGSLQLWDLNIKHIPIKTFFGHQSEISSLDWTCQDVILSSSSDMSIKLWDIGRSVCLCTFTGNTSTVYEASFSVHRPTLFASVAGDGQMKLWSTLNPNPVTSFMIHDSDVLSCDWCKHDPNLIATCGSDSLLRGWDIRKFRQPLFQLKGGTQAIKKIRFSPHYRNILASTSFDYTTKIWDIKQSGPLEVFEHHSDFVYGLDWNSHKIDELVDCSSDQTVKVFTSEVLRHLKNKI